MVRRQIFPPPEIFLEHLLQAFYGVDAPGSMFLSGRPCFRFLPITAVFQCCTHLRVAHPGSQTGKCLMLKDAFSFLYAT